MFRLLVMRRKIIVAAMVAMAAVMRSAPASADVEAGVAARRKIVIRDEDLIRPAVLTMNRGDVLEFQNETGQFMRVVFMEPRDQADKIRCSPVDHTTAALGRRPGMLFDWGAGSRLTATIAPGLSASACSLGLKI